MRAIRLSLGLAALLGLLACDAAERDAPSPTPPAPAEAIPPAPWGAVEAIIGDGQLQLCRADCQPAQKGDPTLAGAAAVTDAQTRAELRLEDRSILRLDTDSRALLGERGVLTLEQGRFLVEAGAQLRLETPAGPVHLSPGASASLIVDLNPQKQPRTQISVLAGDASLEAHHERTPLAAGEAAIAEGDRLRVLPSPDLAWQTAWAREMNVEAEVDDNPDAAPQGVGNITGRSPATRAELPNAIQIPNLKVHVNVRDRVARTEIEQTFLNTTDQTLEGVYTFPLPHDASIVRFAMEINGQWMEGEVVERGRAVRIFDSVVADYLRPRDPALLEWKGGNTFRIRIFPIFPRTQQRVLLWYSQVLPAEGNARRYAYPLPRTGAVGVDHFTFSADVQAAQPIEALRTPMYAASVDLEADQGQARVRFEKDAFHPRQDLVMEWSVPQYDKPRVHQGAGRKEGEDPYFMMVLRPELPVADQKATAGVGARDLMFVVDTSYGTSPADLKAATAAVASWLSTLGPDDRFNVLAADQEVRRWEDAPQPVSHERVSAALAFLEAQTPGGASDLEGMFEAARRSLKAARPDAAPVLVYLGDGQATLGELRHEPLLDALEGHPEERRPVIHAIGMGSEVNVSLLQVLTRRFGGVLEVINRGEDVPRRVAALALGTRRPALRQGTLTFSSDKIDLVYPTHAPTLRYGEELIVVGRYRGQVDGQVTLTGLVGDEPFAQPFALKLDASRAEPESFVPRLWAQRHIEHLTLYGDDRSRQEIIDASVQHTVMSRFTTFLVLESEQMYRRFQVSRDKDRKYWDPSAASPAAEQAAAEPPAPPAAAAEATPTPDPARPADLAGARSDADNEITGGLRAGEDASDTLLAQPALDNAPNQRQGPALFGDEEAEGGANEPDAPAEERQRLAKEDRGARDEAAKIPSMNNNIEHSMGDGGGGRAAPEPKTANKPLADPADPWLGKKGGAAPAKDKAMEAPRATRASGAAGRGFGYRRVQVRNASIRSLPPQPAADADPAGERLQAALEAEPLRRELYRRLLRHHDQRGDAAAGLALATRWIDQDPDNAEAWWLLAGLRGRHGERDSALRSFGNAIELSPQDPALLRGWARQLTLRGLPEMAAAAHRALAARTGGLDDALDLVAAELALSNERARRALARLRAYSSAQLSPAQRQRADALAARIEGADAAAAADPLRGAGVITMGWEGDEDLDLAVLLPYGERVSVDSPRSIKGDGKRGYVALQASRGASRRADEPLEAIVLPAMPDGRYRVEITRASAARPARAWIKVRAQGQTRSFSVEIPAGDHDLRVAEIQLSTAWEIDTRPGPLPTF